MTNTIEQEIVNLFEEDICRSIYAIAEKYGMSCKDVIDIRKPLLKKHGLRYYLFKKCIVNVTTGKSPDNWRGGLITKAQAKKINSLTAENKSIAEICAECNVTQKDLKNYLDNKEGYEFAQDICLSSESSIIEELLAICKEAKLVAIESLPSDKSLKRIIKMLKGLEYIIDGHCDKSFINNKLVVEKIALLLSATESELDTCKYILTNKEGKQYLSETIATFGGNVINPKSKIYGRFTCSQAKRAIESGPNYARNRVFFDREETAIQAGFRPCGCCMRPEYNKWKEAHPQE